MSNIIRVSEASPSTEWLVMSNQGTDCFLDLLITAATVLEQTKNQRELMSFLADQKDFNDVSPGMAGFDLDEMPWVEETRKEDIAFLLAVIETAKKEDVMKQLPYDVDRNIVLPWLEQFATMVRQAEQLPLRHKERLSDEIYDKVRILDDLAMVHEVAVIPLCAGDYLTDFYETYRIKNREPGFDVFPDDFHEALKEVGGHDVWQPIAAKTEELFGRPLRVTVFNAEEQKKLIEELEGPRGLAPFFFVFDMMFCEYEGFTLCFMSGTNN